MNDLLNQTDHLAKVGGWELIAETLEVKWTEEIFLIHELPLKSQPSHEEAIVFYHPEDRPVLKAAIKKALELGEPFDLELRFKTAKGKNLWVHLIGKPHLSGGKTVRLSGTFQDITNKKYLEKTIRIVLEETSSKTGREFFCSLTENLSKALHTRFGFICEYCDPEGKRAKMLSIWKDTEQLDTFSYDTKGTPCENVISNYDVVYFDQIQNRFPGDQWLRNEKLESYMAIPIINSSGRAIGHMGVIHDQSMESTLSYESILRILAVRSCAEIERLRSEKRIKSILDTLKEKEARLTLALDAANGAVWDWNIETGDTFFSPQWMKMLGYEPGDLEQHYTTWERLLHPDDKASVEDQLMKHLQGETETYECRYRLKMKSGDYFWSLYRGKVTARDREGKALKMVGIDTDISEREKHKEACHASEERYRTIFNSSHDAIFIIDPGQDEILEVNSPACKMLGFTREELLSMRVSEIHPDEVSKLEAFTYSVVEKGGGLTQELSCRTKEGLFIPAEISASVINFKKKSSCIMTVIRDISDRKKSEEYARLVAKVFKSVAEAIMITDADKKIISVNTAFTEITGFTESEAIGQNPRILKSGRHDKDFYKEMFETLDDRGHWKGEIWDRRKNGEIYPKWLSISVVEDEDKKILQYIALFSDITQRKDDQKKLYFRAYYDSLTQLPNRTLAFERLEQIIRQDIRFKRNSALFFVDLDHFKQINDTLGHTTGDIVLEMVAKRLRFAVRETDTVARSGGDEFLVILPEFKNQEEVMSVAEKILVQMSLPFNIGGRKLYLGASIGITTSPEDGHDIETLLKNADMAMYKAKSHGRNNYQFFNKQMEATDKERTLLEWDLRQAIEKQELVLHYQPIVDLTSLKTVSLEALVRWNHPLLGLIPPDQFIPLAENSDLISKISTWVLLTACTQMKLWRDRYGLDTCIAVNLSSRDFLYGEVWSLITNALEKSGFPAEALILEITEGLMLDPKNEALKKLQTIKDAGIRLSIDDFGTGYSSLSYLAQYPIDLLKIDKSFIMGAHNDPQKKPLVEAIIRMGQSMGMKIVAEGVETYEDLSYLINLGCDKAQGYYFSKPLPAEDYEVVLENRQIDST